MADDPTFAHGASGPGNVYDTSSSGLGLSPSYLAHTTSSAAAVSDSSQTGGGEANSLSNRPLPADKPNSFFFASDQMVLYFSNGTVWLRVSEPAGAAQLWYANASAPAGYVAYDGSSLPASTGIYADLFAHLGGLVTPDTRGRMMVAKGTHPDVDAIGDTDGAALATRSPVHNSTVTGAPSITGAPALSGVPALAGNVSHNLGIGRTADVSLNDPGHKHPINQIGDHNGFKIFITAGEDSQGNAEDDRLMEPRTTGITVNQPSFAITSGGVNNGDLRVVIGSLNTGIGSLGVSMTGLAGGPGGTRPADTPSYLVFGLLIAKL